MTIHSEQEEIICEKIYHKYLKLMLYVAYSVLKDYSLAEDAVQQSFLKIMEHLDKISDVNSNKTKGFIVILVKNTAIDMLRKLKNGSSVSMEDLDLTLPDPGELPLEQIVSAESYESILRLIDKLDHNYSSVLYLKYVYHYGDEEIAELLNITNQNVRVRLHRARIKLAALLKEEQQCQDRI